jgi:hypothetical protein
MPFNRNFTRVTLAADPDTGGRALFVEGRSEPVGEVTDVFVAVPHDGELLTAAVDDSSLIDWQAKFPDGDPPFEVGDEVFVIGVAMRPPPCDPVLWQGSFEIQGEG